MHDERDAEDARLLSAGDYDTLLAAYLSAVDARVRARVPRPHADDVVQDVMLRLFSELARGRAQTYRVPFRVVVHSVIGWTIKGYFQGQDTKTVPLRDDWELVGEDDVDFDDRASFERLMEPLTEGERRVVELRYGEGREIEEISAILGMTRNAVDQAIHRGLRRLRTLHANG